MNRYITPKGAEMATKYYVKNCSMLLVISRMVTVKKGKMPDVGPSKTLLY